MATIETLLTADDLLARPDDGWRYELRRGELIRMAPAGFQHGDIAAEALVRLRGFVRDRALGRVVTAETGFRLSRDPDTVRAPDVAFVRAERVPADGAPVGYWPGAPDLAVEVVSPGDDAAELRAKIADYLAAGTRLVWVVYPRTRTVSVFRADGSAAELTERDGLDGEDVVPGFTCPVENLFS